jgi:hypothetical protein
MTRQLQGHERDFFSRVAHAGFINQFSEERRVLEAEIAGVPVGTKGNYARKNFWPKSETEYLNWNPGRWVLWTLFMVKTGQF